MERLHATRPILNYVFEFVSIYSQMTRKKKLILILVFNLALMALEIAGGIVSRSLALLSDAGHMLTDSFAVLMGLTAIYLAKNRRTPPGPSATTGPR